MGHVLLARDQTLERDVALKFLHDRLLDDARAKRYFMREARALAKIHDPRVVSVHGVGEWSGRPYLAMEFIAGTPLASAPRDLPISEVLRIADDVAAALAAAHARRIVHGDVNPRNVILREHVGTACLIDFGLARSLDRTTDWSATVAGTPMYMAPEQVAGLPYDVRIDVYSLAATIFELITGRVPHDEAEPPRLFHAVMYKDAPLLRTLRPDAPRSIEVLLARALARAPELRHRDGSAFLSDVRAVRSALEGRGDGSVAIAVASNARPPHDPSEDVPLIGRDAEYRAAIEPITDVHASRGRLVLVEGVSGAGKSRLTREVERAARASGLVAVRCAGSEGSSGSDSPIRDGLRAWMAVAGVRDAPVLMRKASPGGEALAPVLSWWMAGEAEGTREPSRESLANAVVALVTTLSARRPALLIADDIHLFDEGSLDLFAAICESVPSLPLLVMASHRPPGTLSPGVPFLSRLPRLHGVRDRVLVGLGPLDEVAVAATIRHVLKVGESEAARLGPVLHKRSGGNPLYLVEVLKLLEEQGHIADGPSGERRVTERLSRLQMPPRLLELALRRVAGLPEDERDALGVVSIDPDGVSANLVAKCRGTSRIVALRVLQQLVRGRGLVLERSGCYVLDHAEIREAIYEDLIPELRAEYHDVAASMLLAASASSREPGRVGRHLRLAGRRSEAVDPILRAADGAFRRHSPVEALDLYEQAIACAESKGSCEASLGRARSLALLGDLAGARAAYEALRGAEGDSGALVVLRWANFERQRGNPRRALEILDSECPDDCSAELHARMFMVRAEVASELDLSARALADLEQARALAAVGSDEFLADLHAAEGLVAWRCGRPSEARDRWSLALAGFEKLGLSQESCIAMLHNLSLASEDVGARSDALDYNERAVERAALIGNDRTLVFTLMHRADLLIREMRLDEAASALARSRVALVGLGSVEANVVHSAQEAELALAQDDPSAAVAAADRGIAAGRDYARHSAGLRLIRSRALLELGRAEEALADARLARAAFADLGINADVEEALACAARALRVLRCDGAERAELHALTDVYSLAAALERVAAAKDDIERAQWLSRANALATDPRARRDWDRAAGKE